MKQEKLHYSEIGKPFKLHNDTAHLGGGTALIQERRLVILFSYKFTEREREFSECEKELLVVVKSMQHFRKFLWGTNSVSK